MDYAGMLLTVSCIVMPAVSVLYHEKSMTILEPPSALPANSYFGYSIAYQIANKSLIVSAPYADEVGQIFTIHLLNNTVTELPVKLPRDNTTVARGYWLGATLRAGSNFFVACASHYVKSAPASSNEFAAAIGQCVKFTDTGETEVFSPETIDISGYTSNIASGKFFSSETHYAVSGTHKQHGFESVTFYDKTGKIVWTIKNEDIGSMFGTALCTVQLDGARASLLIGAPTHTDSADGGRSFDRGAVYLYTPGDGWFLKLKRTIRGGFDGDKFGSSIINLGDMDGDNKDEIAIAAPYEDGGKGAVYIYSGRGLLKDEDWVQKIKPENVQSFGLSLTAVQDFEDRGCNDLAIGAPETNSVSLLKCISCVSVNLTATFPDIKDKQNDTSFEFETCISFSYPNKPLKIIGNITVKINILYSHIKLLEADVDGSLIYKVSLEDKPQKSCRVNIAMLPNRKNYDKPIEYIISATLDEDPTALEFDSRRVSLCEDSVTLIHNAVWAADCGSDRGYCIPNLRYFIFYSNTPNPYIIGSSEYESFEIVIRNEGETAYSSCIRITVDGANVMFPAKCIPETESSFMCVPQRSIPQFDTWETGYLKLETYSLNSSAERITIKVDVFNHCDKESSQTEEEFFDLKPDVDGIIVKGEANPDSMIDVTPDLNVEETPFEHIYTIINNGHTNWIDVKAKIILEKDKNLVSAIKAATILTDSNSTECVLKEDTNKKLRAICEIGELRKNRKVTVIIPLGVQSLENKDQNVTISSQIDLILKNDRKSLSISTTLKLHSVEVPLWITIAACLGGLVFIAVVAGILYKMGYLQRKDKEKLNKLKKADGVQNSPQNNIAMCVTAKSEEDTYNLVNFLEDNIRVDSEKVRNKE